MRTHTRISRTAAEQVRDLIAARFGADPRYAPTLMEEGWDGHQWVIAWEEGPDEWAYQATYLVEPPAGTFLEAINHYSVAICGR